MSAVPFLDVNWELGFLRYLYSLMVKPTVAHTSLLISVCDSYVNPCLAQGLGAGGRQQTEA